MALPLLLLAAGTALSAWSQYEQGQSQADAAKQTNRMRQLEAQEVMERLNINRQNIYREGERFKTRQQLSIVASGASFDGSTLNELENTNAEVTRKIYAAQKEADFNAYSLSQEGDFALARGNEAARAGQIGSLGTILTGAYGAYSNSSFGGKTKTSFNTSNIDTNYSSYSSTFDYPSVLFNTQTSKRYGL